jgi:type VII secretion effector (TIGR04197 family)
MTGISSNLTVAGGVSSALSRAASALTAVQTPSSFAERTNVTGNSNAKKSISELVSALQDISNSVVKDGNNVHSVAQEFCGYRSEN